MVAIAKDAIWKMRMEGQMAGISFSGSSLVNYFTFLLKRIIWLEGRCMPPEMFKRQWKSVAKMLHIDVPT